MADFTPISAAIGGALIGLGLRRPRSRSLMYCWLKPERSANSSCVRPLASLIFFAFLPTNLRAAPAGHLLGSTNETAAHERFASDGPLGVCPSARCAGSAVLVPSNASVCIDALTQAAHIANVPVFSLSRAIHEQKTGLRTGAAATSSHRWFALGKNGQAPDGSYRQIYRQIVSLGRDRPREMTRGNLLFISALICRGDCWR